MLACVVGSLVAAFFFAEMQSTPSTLNGGAATSSTQPVGNNSGSIPQDGTAPGLVERPEEQGGSQDEIAEEMGGVKNFKSFEEYVVSSCCVPVARTVWPSVRTRILALVTCTRGDQNQVFKNR